MNRITPSALGCSQHLEKSSFQRLYHSARIPLVCDAAHISEQQVASTSERSYGRLGAPLRAEFPILHQQVNGKPLVYLDNAATSQKPTAVLDAIRKYYDHDNSNVHRGVHALAARATTDYEAARESVAKFVGAASDREIVFTRNASEAINLVANSWGMHNLKEGDEMVAQKTGAVLKHVQLTPEQEIDMKHFQELLTPRTKLVSLVHVSNVLGAVLDVPYVVEEAKKVGAMVLLDCCQSVPHMPVNVQTLGADWIVASSHKMCGPTGMGFLWGKYDVLESMKPWMGGGEMIQDVFLDYSTYAPPPGRFEAGTPAIGEAIGLGAACEYLTSLGMDNVHNFETDIGSYLYDRLSKVPGVQIYGPKPSGPRGRASLCSFNVEGLHATDVSTLMDASGVALRSGHHCTQPLHKYLGINASARASAYIYNTEAEIDAFVSSLEETIQFFKEINM
eukprot:gene18266-24720_t